MCEHSTYSLCLRSVLVGGALFLFVCATGGEATDGPGIVGGAVLPPKSEEDDSLLSPPPALKPIEDSSVDRVEESLTVEETPEDEPVLKLRENPPPRIGSPSRSRSNLSDFPPDDFRIEIERSRSGGDYLPIDSKEVRLEAGERLRWKYPDDLEWRILKAFGPTLVQIAPHHYKMGGNFFHSFREGNRRVQVPTLEEAWVRENNPREIYPDQTTLKFFVQVDRSAPKAPPPDGNCAVWEKGRLLLSNRVSGEVDSVVGGKVEHLGVRAMTPGMIFGLQPPSNIFTYAVKVDFEAEIFARLGREKGRCDSELQKAQQLLQVADTPARAEWAQGRVAYEQARSAYLEEEKHYYDLYLRNELDSITLIRSQHPLPHIRFARIVYRHENLEIDMDLVSNHLGEVLVPAHAFLWINEARPVSGSPFEFQLVDKSDPPFMGYDTRFRSEGSKLIVEEKRSGDTSWVPRDVTFDTYTYASFKPPKEGGSPEYLVDLTQDMTGGLKRLDQEMIVNGRIGTIRLTPNDFRIDLAPELLISPVPMTDLHRNIMIGPLDLRGWIFGRRKKIQEAFMKVRMIPDPVLNPFEEMVDELALKAYRIEKEKRTRDPRFQYTPVKMTLKLSKTQQPGVLLAEISMEDSELNRVGVARTLPPGEDLIDFLARSVALNREETDLAEIRPLTYSEWREIASPGAIGP